MAHTDPSPALDTPWPIVARDDELARATSAIGRRDCAVVVLSGESGVGKSRLAAEVAAHAESAGRAVLRVPANALLVDVPLGALAALPVGDGVPLAALAHDAPGLFAAARAAVAALPGAHPALIVVDDLPHLDPLSTTLVSRLVASGDATLLVTHRDGEPLPDSVLSLWSPDRCSRIPLAPFDVAELEAVLQRVLGGPIAHHAAVELHAATDGNPLYLREYVLGARDAGRLTEAGGVWQLVGAPIATPALRELVRSRVRRLDDDARDVVERLAVCTPVPVDQLPGAGALAALTALEATGWVDVADAGGALTARLAHPQYADAIREGLPRLRLVQIASEQAAALEAAPTGPTDTLRVARWRIDAGLRPDPAALATAAALARQAGDHRGVEQLATAALAVTGPRADLLLLQGEALHRLGRVREAIAVLESAIELDVRHPSSPELSMGLVATAAFAYASIPAGMRQGLDLLDRLDASNPAVELMRSVLQLYLLEPDTALATVERAATAFGTSPVEQAVLAHARALPLAGLGQGEGAVTAARAALDLAQQLDGRPESPLPVAVAAQTLSVALLQSARLDEAKDAATLALRAAVATDDEFLTRTAEFRLGQAAIEQGRADTAARWFRESRSGAMSLGPESLIVPSTAMLAIALFTLGDAAGAEAMLAQIPEGTAVEPTQLVAFALAEAHRGALDAARTRLLDGAHDVLRHGYTTLAGQYLFWLARYGDAATAAAELEALPPGEFAGVQARHARAEADADGVALESAADEWEHRGALLYAAEALASAARAARAEGDHRRATARQSRSDALAARCEGAVTPLLRFTSSLVPLTRREREIALLAAQGHSSKQIADELFLSVRTVDNHLQSIYGKLGIRGRHELADAVGS